MGLPRRQESWDLNSGFLELELMLLPKNLKKTEFLKDSRWEKHERNLEALMEKIDKFNIQQKLLHG